LQMIPILLCVVFLSISCSSTRIIVNTSRGSVQGFDHDFGNDTTQLFYGYGQVFLGIPFSQPPVGERKFSLPEPLCQYNERGEVHDATYYRPHCTQTLLTPEPANEMSDDCLYLNVITPNISGSYPVMVWIHGGTFTTGGAEIYHWKGAIRNLVSRGIVLVKIQYRLGLAGFFTTFSERFPPNRGIYDQILALRWVNEEIAQFGGDPSRITIYGQSAGAKSVSDLSLSPLSRGLFHQLIQSSGVDLMEVIDDPRGSIHQRRAEQICGINSTDWGSEEKDQALLDCFLRATPEELVAYDGKDRFNWNVAIDGAFLSDEPENLAKSRPQYPALIGDMLEDYAVFIKGVSFGLLSNISSLTALDILREKWPNYDEDSLKILTDSLIDGHSNGVRPAKDDHMGWARLLSEIFTGLFFDNYAIRDARWHRNTGNDNVWLFTYTHRSLLPFQMEIDGWIPISHSSELPYVWFYPQNWETFNASKADFTVADYLGETWANFVKHGELSLPKAKESLNVVEFGDSITTKSSWRSVSNKIRIAEQLPKYKGIFTPLKTSEHNWRRLRDLGEKVLSKWNSMKCLKSETKSLRTTTRGAPSTSRMALLMLLLVQCLQVIRNMH
ncbi:hypothetical protein PRIPAC_87198, partial [Pristionchus pacificus]